MEEGHWELRESNVARVDEAEPLSLLREEGLQHRGQLAVDGRDTAKGSVVLCRRLVKEVHQGRRLCCFPQAVEKILLSL